MHYICHIVSNWWYWVFVSRTWIYIYNICGLGPYATACPGSCMDSNLCDSLDRFAVLSARCFFYMFPSLKSRQLLFRLRFFFSLECGICFNLSHTTCTNLRHYIVTYFLFEYFHPYRKNTTCPTCWPSPYWTSILGNLSFNVILQEHIVSDMKYTVSNERRPILLWQFIVWYNIFVSEAW